MSRLFRNTLWILVGLSVPVFAWILLSNAIISVPGFLVGLVFAIIYLAVALVFFRVSPMWPGGVLWAVAALMWGASTSLMLAMVSALPIMELMLKLDWMVVMASFGGAYPEEIGKALGVAIVLLSFRRLTRPWHGLVVGALVGLGFELNENLLYGTTGAILHPNSDMAGILSTWGLRTMTGPYLHTVLTALAGFGIGLAFFRAGKSVAWRWGMATGWIGLAFVLHFVWNLLWEDISWVIANYVVVSLIMYPLFIYLVVRCWRAASDDLSYAYSPGMLTSTRELQLHDAALGTHLTRARTLGEAAQGGPRRRARHRR